jgi:hypothetical protein
MKTDTDMTTRSVSVREYLRFRLYKWETIRNHYRRPPSR